MKEKQERMKKTISKNKLNPCVRTLIENMCDYVTTGIASEMIGVTRPTLMNWDRSGKLKAVRLGDSRYRLYKISDIKAFIKQEAAMKTTMEHYKHPGRPRGSKNIKGH